MWEYEHRVETTATAPELWRHWSDMAAWPSWNAGIQKIDVDGYVPFEKGSWSFVAMNADASPGVTVDTRVGARVPFLRWVAIGFLAGLGCVLCHFEW